MEVYLFMSFVHVHIYSIISMRGNDIASKVLVDPGIKHFCVKGTLKWNSESIYTDKLFFKNSTVVYFAIMGLNIRWDNGIFKNFVPKPQLVNASMTSWISSSSFIIWPCVLNGILWNLLCKFSSELWKIWIGSSWRSNAGPELCSVDRHRLRNVAPEEDGFTTRFLQSNFMYRTFTAKKYDLWSGLKWSCRCPAGKHLS